MKTILLSVLTASLLGLATVATGYHFDAADFLAIGFATGLVAWTFAQYNATPRVLRQARPIHLPIKTSAFSKALIAGRRAA